MSMTVILILATVILSYLKNVAALNGFLVRLTNFKNTVLCSKV